MFTGLVEALGKVTARQERGAGLRLQIHCPEIAKQLRSGDSVAINGCCLTATSIEEEAWWMDLVPETLDRTALGTIQTGDSVNLELALRADARLGGHFVQGHVDGIGTLKQKETLSDGSTRVTIETDPQLLRYVVEKGSISVDGVSLTVAAVDASTFQFAMIPHTAMMTTLGAKKLGSQVHLEVDILAKYIEKLTKATKETACPTATTPSYA